MRGLCKGQAVLDKEQDGMKLLKKALRLMAVSLYIPVSFVVSFILMLFAVALSSDLITITIVLVAFCGIFIFLILIFIEYLDKFLGWI
jgi:hypothetical protein